MTAPLPGREPGRPGLSVAGGSSLVVSHDSPRKREAWKLVEYLSRPETQVEFFRLTGNLPSRRSAWEDSLLKEDRYIQAFFRQLEFVAPTPKIPEWEQIASKVMEHVELAAGRPLSDEAVLRSLDRVVDRILEKRRWLMERRISESAPQ